MGGKIPDRDHLSPPIMPPDDENPYHPPRSVEIPALGRTHAGQPLDDPRGRGWLAITFLWLFCLCALSRRVLPETGGLVDGALGTATPGLLPLAYGLTFFGTALMVCLWTYRCAANAARLNGRSLETNPSMAVISYFIPLYNLFGPVVAMFEIVNVTYRHSPRPKVSFAVLVCWWTDWAAFNILSNFSNRLEDTGGAGRIWIAVTLVAMLVSAAMLTIIILKLSVAQAELVVPMPGQPGAPKASLHRSPLPAIEAGLPIPGSIPRRPEPSTPPVPPVRPAVGPHPNAPTIRRPAPPADPPAA